MSLINIINELTVSNIEASLKFYISIFDFEIEYSWGNPITWYQLKKDNVRIMLEDYNTVKEEVDSFPQKADSSNLIKFEFDNLQEFESLYRKCKNNSVLFFMDYTKTEYGKIEFGIFDLDRNMIVVSHFEKR